MNLFSVEGSFSQSPNSNIHKNEEFRNSRLKTGIPVKNMFEGVKFTLNPLNDYQGFEKKASLWKMYCFSSKKF